ncbi:52 kDa repressor of the inhibitor of the protein kinase-like isoform X4 [Daktulosphaira vitifoliae]|uniref:52 kDa repressor of the inhibitor of the protein kinase-like isoform X4 n=1 Tax=Daktulosphaira vitifoliae TaxID=58002 RepID=UPI0021AA2626|nr:52 kDa repressor of the inhibitor of the protein kinase-like isoform X4 [Daktulosphaira vitifoliae]XP_050543845.1 52 kDa repressor of the inhibitor of the protein kinase-like isoform X4 [Daktulosphaira vitifoliae]
MRRTKTGMRCSVQFCENKACFRNKSFFSYPRELERLKKWMKYCNTTHLFDRLIKTNSFKVCADHFENKMFLNVTTRNRLVYDAVPTVFSDEILNKRKLKQNSKLLLKTENDENDFYWKTNTQPDHAISSDVQYEQPDKSLNIPSTNYHVDQAYTFTYKPLLLKADINKKINYINNAKKLMSYEIYALIDEPSSSLITNRYTNNQITEFVSDNSVEKQ